MSAELWSEVVQSRWWPCCRRWEMVEVCGLTFAQMFCHNPFPVLISFRTEDRWRVRSERKLSLQLSPHCSSAGGLSLFFIIDNTTRPINNNMNHTALSATPPPGAPTLRAGNLHWNIWLCRPSQVPSPIMQLGPSLLCSPHDLQGCGGDQHGVTGSEV